MIEIEKVYNAGELNRIDIQLESGESITIYIEGKALPETCDLRFAKQGERVVFRFFTP